MLTFDQIKSLPKEEIAALNRKLAIKIVATKIVLPIAVATVAVLVTNHLLRKEEIAAAESN